MKPCLSRNFTHFQFKIRKLEEGGFKELNAESFGKGPHEMP